MHSCVFTNVFMVKEYSENNMKVLGHFLVLLICINLHLLWIMCFTCIFLYTWSYIKWWAEVVLDWGQEPEGAHIFLNLVCRGSCPTTPSLGEIQVTKHPQTHTHTLTHTHNVHIGWPKKEKGTASFGEFSMIISLSFLISLIEHHFPNKITPRLLILVEYLRCYEQMKN